MHWHDNRRYRTTGIVLERCYNCGAKRRGTIWYNKESQPTGRSFDLTWLPPRQGLIVDHDQRISGALAHATVFITESSH